MKGSRYLLRCSECGVEVFDSASGDIDTGRTAFGPAPYAAATRWAAARNSGRQPLRPDRLATSNAIDLPPPIRGPRWHDRRMLIDAAIGVMILAGLTYIALLFT